MVSLSRNGLAQISRSQSGVILRHTKLGYEYFYLELGALSSTLFNKQRAFEQKATQDFLLQAKPKVQNLAEFPPPTPLGPFSWRLNRILRSLRDPVYIGCVRCRGVWTLKYQSISGIIDLRRDVIPECHIVYGLGICFCIHRRKRFIAIGCFKID